MWVLSGRRPSLLLGAGAGVVATTAVLAARSPTRELRRGLAAASALGAAALALGAWAHLVEPRWIAVPSTRVPWRGPALRVALLTDLHAGPRDRSWIGRIVRRTRRLAPDLVLLGGDFVDGVDADPRKLDALAPLRGLEAPLGVFAVLGNHDSQTSEGDPGRAGPIRRCVESAGIRILQNEHVRLPNGAILVGLGSWRADESDPARAFARVDFSAPALVLAHNFQSLRSAKVPRFDLALVGHTHAGQICVPFTEVCPFLEDDMKPYRYGLYDWPSGGKLYVSSGLGTSSVRARLGARPEIALLELVPERGVRA